MVPSAIEMLLGEVTNAVVAHRAEAHFDAVGGFLDKNGHFDSGHPEGLVDQPFGVPRPVIEAGHVLGGKVNEGRLKLGVHLHAFHNGKGVQLHPVHRLFAKDGLVYSGVVESAVHHLCNHPVGLRRHRPETKAACVGHHARVQQGSAHGIDRVPATESGDDAIEQFCGGATARVMDPSGREVFGPHVVVHHEPGAGGGLGGIGHRPQAAHAIVVEGKQHIGPVQRLLRFSGVCVEFDNVLYARHPVEGLIRCIGQQTGDLFSSRAQVAGQGQRSAHGIGVRRAVARDGDVLRPVEVALEFREVCGVHHAVDGLRCIHEKRRYLAAMSKADVPAPLAHPDLSTKAARVQWVMDELERLYPEVPVPLDHTDPYTLLVAVLLSAQCTDARVNQITPALFARADNPKHMRHVPVDEVREIIRPCGLSPQKSKAIVRLSEILMDEHGGTVPQDMEALERLPGVGHKTASVVMSQAFGVPAFPVDTHIHRLMYRWNFTNGKNVEQTERDAKRLFPEGKWNKLHLQIIFYGREYSPARSPKRDRDFITRTIGRKSEIAKLK